MAATEVEIVVSGPDPRGRWRWRLKDGSGGYSTAPADLVDHEWENGAVLRRVVERAPGGHRLIGRVQQDDPEPALLMLNGVPFELPPESELEPGTVVVARVPFSNHPGEHDAGTVAKRRPVAVVSVGLHTVVVRALYSRNTEARGSQLLDPDQAGLRHESIIHDDETVLALTDIGGIIGRLSARDRRRLGLDI